nr:hypothetical protein [uncultured Roseateles sp.]
MAQDDDAQSTGQGSPKRKTLDLDLLFGPVTSVPTTVGTVYLYGLRASDFDVLQKLTEAEPSARFRALLPCIASLVESKGFKDERQPIPAEEVDRLTVSDLDALAEAYAAKIQQRVRADSDTRESPPQRAPDEPSTAYLDRVLKQEVKAQLDQLLTVREKMLASTSSIFDKVRKSSSALGSTLSAFDQLTKSTAPVEIRAPNMDHFHAMNEQFARQARERAEELEMVRLTGKMTAESAKTLKDLAEAATVLLQQLDERDKKADKSTSKQITIAVWSVGISAVLALFALVFSGLAYFQDKANNAAGDKWQSELISAVQSGNQQREAADKEARQLRDQVAALEAKIARIETATTAALPGKSATSASAHRATSPDGILPPP